jgi:hypothetical protein
LGFGDEGVGCRVWGVGCRFRIQGLGERAGGEEYRLKDSGFIGKGEESGAKGFRDQKQEVQVFEFGVKGSGSRV